MPMPKIPVYLYILFALAVLSVIWCLKVIIQKNAENDAKPILTIPVRLIKKKQYYHGHGRSTFSLFFLTENEELLEFDMRSSFEWDVYNEGDLGFSSDSVFISLKGFWKGVRGTPFSKKVFPRKTSFLIQLQNVRADRPHTWGQLRPG